MTNLKKYQLDKEIMDSIMKFDMEDTVDHIMEERKLEDDEILLFCEEEINIVDDILKEEKEITEDERGELQTLENYLYKLMNDTEANIQGKKIDRAYDEYFDYQWKDRTVVGE